MGKISQAEIQERQSIIDALESDASLVKLCQANVIAPRRLMAEIDRLLLMWGRMYWYEDKREIMLDTGIKAVMGRLVKNQNRQASVISMNDNRFESVNQAVVRMPLYYRDFIVKHYVIDETERDYRNDEPVIKYVDRIGVSRSGYNQTLYEAKQLAVAYGVI